MNCLFNLQGQSFKTHTIVAVVSCLLASIDRGRVLICAQSNAAVDEVASRVCSDIYGRDGKLFKPDILRVGNAKSVHINLVPFSLDALVDERLKDERANNRVLKQNLRKGILKECQIMLTTLNGCGGELYNLCAESEEALFDVVVVDEAAQALEPAKLIPLQLLR